MVGGQDDLVALSQEQRVPTFWANCADEAVTIADVVVLLVAMAFGAVHCIVWSYAFPSHMELLMWHVSAISIVAVPVAILLSLAVYILICLFSETLANILLVTSFIVCAIFYIAGRILLLVLSFTTLRSLPIGAYQTVKWTTFVPHI